ncbi:MAG: M48 family metallopeptidase [Burkholderiales bacterium]
MHPLTALFLAALLLATAVRLYLAYRHVRYVCAHRDRVPSAFVGAIPLEAHRKAADYTAVKTRFGMLGTLVDAVVLLALTFGEGLNFAHRVVSDVLAPGIGQGIALIALVAIVLSLIEIPFSLYRTFRIEERFGFNKMTLKLFLIDLVKGALVAALLGLPLVALIVWLMNVAGSLWWLYAWAAWSAFNLLVLALYPTFIAPFFNRFSPMQDEALRGRIERLLARCGFRAQGLFVMDGSRRSSHGNAYFTGFGRSKRIVFFDTLLARLEHAEIEAVLAHELGHFKHKHVLKRIAWMFAASLGLFWLLGSLMSHDWFYRALGVQSPSTAMALLLFFLVLPVFTFLLQPVAGFYSRRHEFEADRYAAQNASAAELKQALIKLYKDNASTLTPDPLHSVFYDSHPPAAARIARLEAAAPAT